MVASIINQQPPEPDVVRITRKKIRVYSGRFLNYLQDAGIKSVQDLDEIIKKEYYHEPTDHELICVSFREAPDTPFTYSLSYLAVTMEKGFNPITAEIERDSLKACVVLSCNVQLEGYNPSGARSGSTSNIRQSKSLGNGGVEAIVEELRRLSAPV